MKRCEVSCACNRRIRQKRVRRAHSLFVVVALLCGVSVASANTVYSNINDAGSISSWNGSQLYGEIFTLADATTLDDFSLYAAGLGVGGTTGNIALNVAAWNGNTPVGPTLYSGTDAYAGGAQAITYSGMNTALLAGTYIAFITAAGVSNAATNVMFAGATGNGGIGLGFVYSDPSLPGGGWAAYSVPNLQFSATVGVTSPVPVPGSALLLIGGLGAFGWMRRRQITGPKCSGLMHTGP